MKNLFTLSGKAAIVTGAARGNGKAIAGGFIDAGADVYFCDILERELTATVKAVKSKKAHAVVVDVAKREDLEQLVQRVYKEQGRIDVLVNNAGIGFSAPSEEYSEAYWDKTIAVDLKAVFILSQLVGRHMIVQKSGAIINITSLNAEQGFPNNPAYVASKGGLKQLTRALARDWGQYNIRVNNIGPGYIRTNMTQKSWNDPVLRADRTNRTILGRWGTPDDLVGSAVFLASDASAYVTGQDLYVDGGWLAKGL